jgi:hypothetical protein
MLRSPEHMSEEPMWGVQQLVRSQRSEQGTGFRGSGA